LNDASELDDLLPLYRRKVFEADLARLSKEALESSNSLVMIMADLDHFKKAINDTHGHPIGDQVLLGASKIVTDRVRGKGIRVTYFSGGQPKCPKDAIPLRVLKEFHEVGRKTPTIIIMCPVCGLQEMINELG
jgi:hypothetical protein